MAGNDETTVPEQESAAEPPALLSEKDYYVRTTQDIINAGLELHKQLWDAKDETELIKLEDHLNKYPATMRIKLASFALFFSRMAPIKILQKVEHTNRPGQRVTAADLAEWGLTPAQLKKIAGIKD